MSMNANDISAYTIQGMLLGPYVKAAFTILKRGITIVLLDFGKHQSFLTREATT
jgi:hypothetical protein